MKLPAKAYLLVLALSLFSTELYPQDSLELTRIDRKEGINKRFIKRGLVPSAGLIIAGVIVMQEESLNDGLFDYRQQAFPNFNTDADDFAMLAPLVGLYGVNLISSANRHEIPRQTLLLISSGVLTSALVWPTKKWTDKTRPDGDPYAFPSGHTAYAFTIATFMDKEYRHRRPWISVASYAIATATGIARVMNNDHWLSDVLAGAGVGILSVNTVYWLHSKITENKKINAQITPIIMPGQHLGMHVSMKF